MTQQHPKKIPALILVLILVFLLRPPPSISAEPVLIVGDAAYPPYSYVQNGRPAGIYVEILRQAFARMPKFEVTIRMQPWKRCLASIKSGQALAVFPPYRKPAQRGYMAPYSTPILREEVIALCNDEGITSLHSPKWPEGFSHLRIGRSAGFAIGGDKYLSALHSGRLSHVEVQDAKAGLRMLSHGRIHCYLNDRRAIAWALAQMRAQGWNKDKMFHEATVVSQEYGHLGYSTASQAPGKERFIRRFNAVIDDMRRSGEIDMLAKDISRYGPQDK